MWHNSSKIAWFVTATIPVSGVPYGIAYDPNKGEIFVANNGVTSSNQNTVSVISDSSNTVTATVTVSTYRNTNRARTHHVSNHRNNGNTNNRSNHHATKNQKTPNTHH